MRRADVQEANTTQVTFRLQGPLKRSTFQREPPDPVEETLGDVLHWSWSTRMQAARLREGVSAEFIAWNREGRHRMRQVFSKTSCDEHLLLVCAANLDRALDKLPKQFRRDIEVPKPWRRGLWLLRNVYEHWNELRRHLRAGTDDAKGTVGKLRREFPNSAFTPVDQGCHNISVPRLHGVVHQNDVAVQVFGGHAVAHDAQRASGVLAL